MDLQKELKNHYTSQAGHTLKNTHFHAVHLLFAVYF